MDGGGRNPQVERPRWEHQLAGGPWTYGQEVTKQNLGILWFQAASPESRGSLQAAVDVRPRNLGFPNDSCHLHMSHVTAQSLSFPWTLEKDKFQFYFSSYLSCHPYLRPYLLGFSLDSSFLHFPHGYEIGFFTHSGIPQICPCLKITLTSCHSFLFKLFFFRTEMPQKTHLRPSI